MGDVRTRRQKLHDMAADASSPNEAEIARAKLAEMGAADGPPRPPTAVGAMMPDPEPAGHTVVPYAVRGRWHCRYCRRPARKVVNMGRMKGHAPVGQKPPAFIWEHEPPVTPFSQQSTTGTWDFGSGPVYVDGWPVGTAAHGQVRFSAPFQCSCGTNTDPGCPAHGYASG